MARRKMLVVVPVVFCSGLLLRAVFAPIISRGAERRIMSNQAGVLETRLGTHLYAPTWLPYGGRVGSMGAVKGKRRILQDFTDDQERTLLIIAQEPRSPDRDKYNRKIFVTHAEARATFNGKPCYFITGTGGERRLFWNEDKAAVIISSAVLHDRELLDIAKKVE